MVLAQENVTRVGFGLFEADLSSGELWKAGHRIKLQSQPFKVMVALLEHKGEVVSREDLQARLWGKDAVGDFDHSLITAINKIREALGDTADNPRFIETLARRGYRWIAPVTILDRRPVESELCIASPISTRPFPAAEAVPVPLLGSPVLGPATPESALSLDSARPPRSRRMLVGIPAGVFLGLILLLLVALLTGLAAWLPTQFASVAPLLRIEQLTRSGRIAPGKPSMESLPASVTDGLRLYVPVLSRGQSVLSQIDVHTGAVQPLALPAEIASPTLGDISPDGETLLVRSHLSPESEQPFWLVPISGGSALRLPGVIGHDATWMPSGKKILVASGNQLIVSNPEDGSSVPFATLNGRAFWLRWSPDGTLLRFTLLDPIAHTMRLGEIGRDGKHLHTILDNWTKPSSECCGVWTGDGGSFVFQSTHAGQAGSIDLWKLKGKSVSSPVRVTDGPSSYVAPIAGRIGSRIYFLGLEEQSTLQSYDLALRQFAGGPAFLADAARVEYSRDRQWVTWTDTAGHQWRAHADGSEVIRLTSDSLQVFMGHWSSDGRYLALMAREPGHAWRIYLLQVEGGALKPVLQESRNEADPTFSADGEKIAFGRVSDVMGKEEGPRQLEIVDLRTGKVEAIPGSDGLFSPRWSPDGRYIAALSLDQRRLLLFDTASRAWRTLAETTAADPVWSADSRAIFFHAALAEMQPIYRISIGDGRMQQVADLASLATASAVDYFFCGLGPDDAPIVRTRTATGDLYSMDLP